MNARWTALASAALLLPALASAQRPGDTGRRERPDGPPDSAAMARMREQRMARTNPIRMLLDNRAEIGLGDDQVARLARLRDQLDAQNRPLLARLDSLRPRFGPRPGRAGADDERRGGGDHAGPPAYDELTAAQRDSLDARRRAAVDLMGDIGENVRQARKAADQLLTPVQAKRVEGIEARMRERMGGRGFGPEGRGRRGPRDGMPGDAMPPMGGPPMGGPPIDGPPHEQR